MVEQTTVGKPQTTVSQATTPSTAAPVTPQQPSTTEPIKSKETVDDSLLGNEQKPEAPAQTTAPEKYELKMPEGIEVDNEMLTALTPVLQKHNISQDALQALADVYAPLVQKNSEAQIQRYQQQQEQAFNEVRQELRTETMKALGENAKTVINQAGKALEKFGSQALRDKLIAVGLDNDLDMVQAWANVGKSISQDSFVEPAKTNADSEDNMLKKMYPKMSAMK